MGYRASSVPSRVEKARNGKETSNLIVSFPLNKLNSISKKLLKISKSNFLFAVS